MRIYKPLVASFTSGQKKEPHKCEAQDLNGIEF